MKPAVANRLTVNVVHFRKVIGEKTNPVTEICLLLIIATHRSVIQCNHIARFISKNRDTTDGYNGGRE